MMTSKESQANREQLMAIYGVQYFNPGSNVVVEATKNDLYYYKTHIGNHQIEVEFGDCVFYLSDDNLTAILNRGPVKIKSKHIATIIRGYMPENKTSTLFTKTSLPYVNGCSTILHTGINLTFLIRLVGKKKTFSRF
jgi:hypothetical protein